ncbi:MAG: hypothetical protein QXP35_02430 [Candidatus Micrarchaeaceae archaeon]
MKKLEKQIVVYINSDLDEWLSAKTANGYKKASLIRHLLQKQVDFERNAVSQRAAQ